MATKKWTEYWVEFNFIDTKWGVRPMNIKVFKTEAEAIAFAETVEDANLLESVATKC